MFKKLLPAGGVATAALLAFVLAGAHADSSPDGSDTTATPIKHVVVIFDENESFDHYFGTYPNATNQAGEPSFTAKPGTPEVNGLTGPLLTANPNAANPQRLDRSQAVTCSNNHGYTAEQQAFDGGLMDGFVQHTAGCGSIVMDYFDGNTVTGLWNLAQNFSLDDDSYGTDFGPSTVGALNLISGQTHGAMTSSSAENGTVTGDPDPSTALDDCANGDQEMSGQNIGNLLNARGVTWGWFQGGFKPSSLTQAGRALCLTSHKNISGASEFDYSAHHEPFEYYPSTANVHHTQPASVADVGRSDPDSTPAAQKVNHQYDLTNFTAALQNGNLPAVSFLKPGQYEDAHPGNSDPLDEQTFIANTLDALEASPDWSSTAVVIAYDDSDGWYDHQQSPIVNSSAAPSDALNGTGRCGSGSEGFGTGTAGIAYSDRCGYGPRLPMLVISPYAKENYVDHTLTDQSSILRFIEDNWSLGRIGDGSADATAGTIENMFDFSAGPVAPRVFLDASTGEVTRTESMTPPPADGQPGTGTTPPATVTVASPAPPAVTTTVRTPAPPAPRAKPAAKPKPPKLACTTSGSGRKITVSCKLKSGSVAKKTALRARLMQGKKVLATSRATVSHNAAKTVLQPKKAVKKGRYTLSVTLTQPGTVTAQKQSIRIG